MFAQHNPSMAYAQVGVETGVVGANPHKLILILFDGIIMTLGTTLRHMRAGEIAAKGESVSRAIDIISGGLQASLNIEAGGELAERLDALYHYMIRRLLHANLHNDQTAIEEVLRLLGELRSAWEEIADDPAVVSANRAAA